MVFFFDFDIDSVGPTIIFSKEFFQLNEIYKYFEDTSEGLNHLLL